MKSELKGSLLCNYRRVGCHKMSNMSPTPIYSAWKPVIKRLCLCLCWVAGSLKIHQYYEFSHHHVPIYPSSYWETSVFISKGGRWSLTARSVQVAASGGSRSNYAPVTMLCPCRGWQSWWQKPSLHPNQETKCGEASLIPAGASLTAHLSGKTRKKEYTCA